MNEMKHTVFSAATPTFVPLCAISASDAAMARGDMEKGGGICEAGPTTSHSWRYALPSHGDDRAGRGPDGAVGTRRGQHPLGDGVTGNMRMVGTIALITITLAAVFCGCSEKGRADEPLQSNDTGVPCRSAASLY